MFLGKLGKSEYRLDFRNDTMTIFLGEKMVWWLYKGINAELCGADAKNENVEICGTEIYVDLLSTKYVSGNEANVVKRLTIDSKWRIVLLVFIALSTFFYVLNFA